MLKRKAKLLTEKERKICEELARIEAGQASLRAAALLAVNKGSTYPQAAMQTGLTRGQVSYAATSFRKKKLALFPADIVDRSSLPHATGQVDKGAGKGEQHKKPVGTVTVPDKKTKSVKEKKTMAKSEKDAEEKKAKKSKVKVEKKALKAKEKKAAKKREKKALKAKEEKAVEKKAKKTLKAKEKKAAKKKAKKDKSSKKKKSKKAKKK